MKLNKSERKIIKRWGIRGKEGTNISRTRKRGPGGGTGVCLSYFLGNLEY